MSINPQRLSEVLIRPWFELTPKKLDAGRKLDADQRKRLRQLRSKLITNALHEWLALHRQRATDGTAIARAIDYSLGRWAALVRFVDDGDLPIDNNW